MRSRNECRRAVTERTEQHAQLERLVLDAFAIAARERKAEWHRMRGSVLKNRLLDLTDRRFDEADYGTERFGTFVEHLGEMLEVDYSAKPFMVELREPFRSQIESAEQAPESFSKGTIRSDLWNAIMDYSRAEGWVWDCSTAMAIPAGEGADENVGDLLPTVDRFTLQAWRIEFLKEHSAGLRGHEAHQTQDWASKGLGTGALPTRLRGPWNIHMRDAVRDRLIRFFEARELEPPSDMLVQRRPQEPVDELRSFIRRCIALMGEQELSELRIPADIAMRAH